MKYILNNNVNYCIEGFFGNQQELLTNIRYNRFHRIVSKKIIIAFSFDFCFLEEVSLVRFISTWLICELIKKTEVRVI